MFDECNNYYTLQLNSLTGNPIYRSFKFTDDKSKTNWMNINKESAKQLMIWIMENYDEMEG